MIIEKIEKARPAKLGCAKMPDNLLPGLINTCGKVKYKNTLSQVKKIANASRLDLIHLIEAMKSIEY